MMSDLTEPALPLPLADLHRHLDGSLRRSTLEELALHMGKSVPHDLAFTQGMGLDEALARFAFTLSLIQDPRDVRRVASEICEDARAENVATLEIRFAPQLHHGASIEAIVDAALDGIDGRAGLILCGLYGEAISMLESLVDIAKSRSGVVAIDLAGGPSPAQNIGLADYAKPFKRAADLGIGRTVHAAEGRSPNEIRIAIEELHAQRIGHGTTLLNDPSIVDLVISQNVVIEACPTSNVHTGVIASIADHPLATWIDRGIRACVNTDNTLLSLVDAKDEHRRALSIRGMTIAKLEAAIATGHAAAFRRH